MSTMSYEHMVFVVWHGIADYTVCCTALNSAIGNKYAICTNVKFRPNLACALKGKKKGKRG